MTNELDLISRKLVLAEISAAQDSLKTNNDAMWNINQKYYKGLAWAHRIVLDAEAAKVKEIIQAEWLVPDEYYPDTCSNCRFEFAWDGDEDYIPKFCPECGAGMVGRRLLYK